MPDLQPLSDQPDLTPEAVINLILDWDAGMSDERATELVDVVIWPLYLKSRREPFRQSRET